MGRYRSWSDRLTCSDPKCPRAGELGHQEDRTNVDFYGQPGSGKLSRNSKGEPVYSTPWLDLAKPTRMPAEPKARRETAEKLALRLAAEIKANSDRLAAGKAQSYVGKRGAYGYEMLASDGHRALMRKTDQKTPTSGLEWLGKLTGYKKAVIHSSEFHLAVKRGLVMADSRRRTIMLLAEPGRLTVASSDPDIGSFDEVLSAVESTDKWRVCLDGKYLESLCGVWPLTLWVKDEESAVVFEFGEWRLILMPMGWASWLHIEPREPEKESEPVETAEETIERQILEAKCEGPSWGSEPVVYF